MHVRGDDRQRGRAYGGVVRDDSRENVPVDGAPTLEISAERAFEGTWR
jgi:hypothetical protein